jgi:PIN like domain
LSTSNTSKQPEEPIYFIDRNLGRKRLPSLLKKVGMKVEVLHSYFPAETPDDEWIPKVVAKGWVILTGDKAIETDPINLKAVEESAAKVFITADTNSKAEEWAAAVIVARRKIARTVEYNNGAFCVDIDKHASNHVSTERYRGSGGPKPNEEKPIPLPPPAVLSAAVEEPEESDSQQKFQFRSDPPPIEPSDDDIMIDIQTQRKIRDQQKP